MAGVFENALLRRFRATVTDNVKISSNRASVPEAPIAWEGRPAREETNAAFSHYRVFAIPRSGKKLGLFLASRGDGSLKQNSPSFWVLSAISFAYVTTFTI
jgi:hypothetical protein